MHYCISIKIHNVYIILDLVVPCINDGKDRQIFMYVMHAARAEQSIRNAHAQLKFDTGVLTSALL